MHVNIDFNKYMINETYKLNHLRLVRRLILKLQRFDIIPSTAIPYNRVMDNDKIHSKIYKDSDENPDNLLIMVRTKLLGDKINVKIYFDINNIKYEYEGSITNEYNDMSDIVNKAIEHLISRYKIS